MKGSGESAAHGRRALSLLPSGPDEIRRRPLHRTRTLHGLLPAVIVRRAGLEVKNGQEQMTHPPRLGAAADSGPKVGRLLLLDCVASESLRMSASDPLKDMESMKVWMAEAVAEARAAAAEGEVPVGAVVVRNGRVLGRGRNRREGRGDPLAHAELEAIGLARKEVGGWRFEGCAMYVTLEPCAMCAGALVNARFEQLIFGAADPKAGFCGSLGDLVRDPRLNHRLEVTAGVLAEESSAMLKEFFSRLRGS